jgi:hypothetical protein
MNLKATLHTHPRPGYSANAMTQGSYSTVMATARMVNHHQARYLQQHGSKGVNWLAPWLPSTVAVGRLRAPPVPWVDDVVRQPRLQPRHLLRAHVLGRHRHDLRGADTGNGVIPGSGRWHVAVSQRFRRTALSPLTDAPVRLVLTMLFALGSDPGPEPPRSEAVSSWKPSAPLTGVAPTVALTDERTASKKRDMPPGLSGDACWPLRSGCTSCTWAPCRPPSSSQGRAGGMQLCRTSGQLVFCVRAV